MTRTGSTRKTLPWNFCAGQAASATYPAGAKGKGFRTASRGPLTNQRTKLVSQEKKKVFMGIQALEAASETSP